MSKRTLMKAMTPLLVLSAMLPESPYTVRQRRYSDESAKMNNPEKWKSPVIRDKTAKKEHKAKIRARRNARRHKHR